MAISREKKQELVAQYVEWIGQSQAMVVSSYTGLTMKDFDALRAKIREAGGEFHVVKNTLAKLAFRQAGLEFPEELFEKDTAIGFAFSDPPAVAKAIVDLAKENEAVQVKAGYLDQQLISPAEVTALAELPPLPVMRAQLLGVIMAPASKLARLLAEPGRQVAAVIKAYADQSTAEAAA